MGRTVNIQGGVSGWVTGNSDEMYVLKRWIVSNLLAFRRGGFAAGQKFWTTIPCSPKNSQQAEILHEFRHLDPWSSDCVPLLGLAFTMRISARHLGDVCASILYFFPDLYHQWLEALASQTKKKKASCSISAIIARELAHLALLNSAVAGGHFRWMDG